MSEVQIPFGGYSNDLNSRRSRQEVVNCYARSTNDGKYLDLVSSQGLETLVTVGTGPIRGMYNIREDLFVASGAELYKISSLSATPSKIGNIAGTTSIVRMNSNGADNNQLIVIADNIGYIYDSTGFNQITDIDFTPDVGVASLDQRFWLNKPGTNKFFASEIGDGFNYNSLDFASAEQSPDILLYPVATKTHLWLMGSETCEYWQSVNASFPVRRVTGGTIQKGLEAKGSVVQFEDKVFFLASDFTIRMLVGSSMQKISDLQIEQSIRGDGTLQMPGYKNPADAEAFFIDHPSQKFYCITFVDDDVTWCFDLSTGVWHKRRTGNSGRWLPRDCISIYDNLIVGSSENGQLYKLVESRGDTPDPVIVVTPPLSAYDGSVFITKVELIMEVGVGGISNNVPSLGINQPGPVVPKVQIEYSKDGGKTWKRKDDVSIGAIGDYEVRVISRLFGYVKRGFDFCLRITVTDPVLFKMYSLHADVNKGR